MDFTIGCKADNSKKINVYFINSFNSFVESEFISIVKNCVELFDSNDFPVILLSIFNQGGIISNDQLLLELLSSTTTINIYGAFENNGIYKDNNSSLELLLEFADSEKCEPYNYEKLINSTKKLIMEMI